MSDISIEVAPDSNVKEKYKFKVVVVGDSGVGKTNLIHRFISDTFSSDTKATVGVEFLSKAFLINNEVFKIEIWDTAGQERYKSMTAAYYKGAMGALIVYDVTSESSFESVERWLSEIKQIANKSICIEIIGNKSDLSEERKVSSETATAKAQQLNAAFMETSALNASNVKEAFYEMLKAMYKLFQPKIEGGDKDKQEKVNEADAIELGDKKPEKKGGCC